MLLYVFPYYWHKLGPPYWHNPGADYNGGGGVQEAAALGAQQAGSQPRPPHHIAQHSGTPVLVF